MKVEYFKSAREARQLFCKEWSIDEIDKARQRVPHKDEEIVEALEKLRIEIDMTRHFTKIGDVETALQCACNVGATWMAILNKVEGAKGKRASEVWDFARKLYAQYPKLKQSHICAMARDKFKKATGEKCPIEQMTMERHFKKQVVEFGKP